MRRALIGIFLAATMATPLAAQDTDETQVREVARERAPRGEDGESRSARIQQRMEERAERQSRREAPEREARPEPPRQEERARERTERTETDVSRREGMNRTIGGSRRDDRRDQHRETHRDYQREHDRLHRSDPTRREHERFHREVNRDHNRWHQRWDHNWRRDSRYDWERYRYSNRGLYSLGRYNAPYRGYRYRPLSIGIRLGSGFYSHPYWINDPWRYRLPHAYAGTRWVRYYDDVLLVDLFTGEVVDVIRNFFW